ncbi:MAG: M20/M25/M40 family metallo-hydrolase [Kiritimatiellia bacterium]|jgi:acetylornithine deacetylase/succinyl-diaminopimelate desuccinylase-like protein|nr:M20/M25/M40 family metallo-hydrolase [Kiritimatiellia bacterium]
MSGIQKEDLEQVFEQNLDVYIDDWKRFLEFASVGTIPEHDQDCVDCADWLMRRLGKIGFQSEILRTDTKPCVFAERKGDPKHPVVLFYGHYDVQPADPIEKWDSPPFEPSLRNGRMYARGAEDNKGQVLFVIEALEALVQQDALNATVKVILEGEEESGSKGISASLSEWRDRLAADILMVCDTGTVRSGAPTIIMGLRGIIFLSVHLTGPDHDLHSGVHGGVAPNPAQGVAELIASLHNADGSVAVPGFYDGVQPPSENERVLANSVPFDKESYLRDTGVEPVAGEQRYTQTERIGFRPTIDINGVNSGYSGEGAKTIIPSSATAKLSARLVPGQDPSDALDAIIDHLEAQVPAGLELEVTDTEVAGPGFRLDFDSALVNRAKLVLDQLSDQDTAFLWEGASIPVVSALAEASGAEPLLVGFGREEDRIHAVNESFSIEQFRDGFLYAALFLASL